MKRLGTGFPRPLEYGLYLAGPLFNTVQEDCDQLSNGWYFGLGCGGGSCFIQGQAFEYLSWVLDLSLCRYISSPLAPGTSSSQTAYSISTSLSSSLGSFGNLKG